MTVEELRALAERWVERGTDNAVTCVYCATDIDSPALARAVIAALDKCETERQDAKPVLDHGYEPLEAPKERKGLFGGGPLVRDPAIVASCRESNARNEGRQNAYMTQDRVAFMVMEAMAKAASEEK